MMNRMEFYFSFMNGLFCFFIMELFMTYNNKDITKSKKLTLRCYYLIFAAIYAYLPSSNLDLFWSFLSDFIYIYILHSFKLKKALSAS